MKAVLLSGGIDSLVCAELAELTAEDVCVFVDYGHPAQIPEGWKAFAYCGTRGITLKVVHAFGLGLGDMASEEGARVVPHRNAILLTLAANTGAEHLVIGCNAEDQRDYVDCRPAFLRSMAVTLGCIIQAPLSGHTKPQVIELARGFGLARSDAWSCYLGGPRACGECPSCVEADRAWA